MFLTLYNSLSSILLISYGISQVIAAPAIRDDVATALTDEQVAYFKPYVSFAGAGYCDLHPGWSCGVYCSSHPNFQLGTTGSGGGGPRWYVGYDPDQKEIIVGHEGTTVTNIFSIANDTNIHLVPLPQENFPGVPTDVMVHERFLKAQTSVSSSILAAVNNILEVYPSPTVVVTGHSIGAALASLTGLMLRRHLSASISVRTIAWASPRIGNEHFADLMDEYFVDYHRINNKDDVIPLLPRKSQGYAHIHGEIHIENDTFYSCLGRENNNEHCTNAILDSDFDDHDGPYFGVTIGSDNCTQ